LSFVSIPGCGGALSGSLPAGKHTIAGGVPPGKLYAVRSEDAPVLALWGRLIWSSANTCTQMAPTRPRKAAREHARLDE